MFRLRKITDRVGACRMQVLSNAAVAIMDEGETGYRLAERASIVIDGSAIAWVGADADLPAAYRGAPSRDLDGRVVTPGLIDCHTHIVYGGDRAREFEMRLEGASYEEIARAGGGILS